MCGIRLEENIGVHVHQPRGCIRKRYVSNMQSKLHQIPPNITPICMHFALSYTIVNNRQQLWRAAWSNLIVATVTYWYWCSIFICSCQQPGNHARGARATCGAQADQWMTFLLNQYVILKYLCVFLLIGMNTFYSDTLQESYTSWIWPTPKLWCYHTTMKPSLVADKKGDLEAVNRSHIL